MLVKITESRGSCTLRVGEIYNVRDSVARQWVKQGVAVIVNRPEPSKTMPRGAKEKRGGYMEPPRNICVCGFVAPTANELEEHKEDCA